MKQYSIISFTLDTMDTLPIMPKKWDRIFLRGDLGAGKTTLVKHLISRLLGESTAVRSPTYVYYNRYRTNIYHFDLYRLHSYEDFVNIGWEEILDNPDNICLIEWPEILNGCYTPTIDIHLLKVEGEEGVRKMEIRMADRELSIIVAK